MSGETCKIKFRERQEDEDGISWLRDCFENLLDQLIFQRLNSGQLLATDRVGLVLINEESGFDPIYITFLRPDQFSVNIILDRYAVVAQSNRDFFFNGNFEVLWQHIRMPLGLGKALRMTGVSMAEYAKRKYGIITYNKPRDYNDSFCLAYSLVLGIPNANGEVGKLRSFKRYFSKLEEAGRDLCRQAGVNLTNGGGYDEIHKFQNYLKDSFKICVYSDRYGESVIYETITDEEKKLKPINLILWANHYYTIKSFTAAFACAYYCAAQYIVARILLIV